MENTTPSPTAGAQLPGSENEALIERVRKLMLDMNMRQTAFANRLGIDASNLSKYLSGKLPITESLMNRMVVNLGVSKPWIAEGRGSAYTTAAARAPQVVTVPAGDVTAPTVIGTPVYDIDVTAGAMPRAMMFAQDQIIGSINMPDVISADCRVVRVSGDSMTPVIHDGDYVALRELTSMRHIFWGQIYVVLLDDFRLIKYVRRNNDPQLVTLRSANPDYDDMEVARQDIRELMLVQHILHLDTRM